jgi:hypothetical protein
MVVASSSVDPNSSCGQDLFAAGQVQCCPPK